MNPPSGERTTDPGTDIMLFISLVKYQELTCVEQGQNASLMCVGIRQTDRMSCSFNSEPESPAFMSV